jgi:hypothetical protein
MTTSTPDPPPLVDENREPEIGHGMSKKTRKDKQMPSTFLTPLQIGNNCNYRTMTRGIRKNCKGKRKKNEWS